MAVGWALGTCQLDACSSLRPIMGESSNERGNEKSVCLTKSGSRRSRLVRTIPACFAWQRGSKVEVGDEGWANDMFYHSKTTVSETRGACGLCIGGGVIELSSLVDYTLKHPVCVGIEKTNIQFLVYCISTINHGTMRMLPHDRWVRKVGSKSNISLHVTEFCGDGNVWTPVRVITVDQLIHTTANKSCSTPLARWKYRVRSW